MVYGSLTVNADKQIEKSSKDIDKALKEKSKQKVGTTSVLEGSLSVTNYFYYTIQGYPQGKCLFL